MTSTDHSITVAYADPQGAQRGRYRLLGARSLLIHGDALEMLRTLPSESVHAVVTDPPYGLADHQPDTVAAALTAWVTGDREHVPDGKGFMGRAWDAFVPPPAVWDECLRVLKPGGYLLCFAGSRTVDLMGLSIRLAGFEIRDEITAWLYGSGFPKSLDVSKAIDKAAGVTREVVGNGKTGAGRTAMNDAPGNGRARDYLAGEYDITAPATDAARQWSGWGTALKPSHEPVIIARKPQVECDTLTLIGSHLERLESECRSPARRAGLSSSRTHRGEPEAKTGSAPESVETPPEVAPETVIRTGEAAASCGTTDTSWSESATTTCLNIVESWRKCWAELCSATNTSITATTSSTTTDLRTLSSCLSRLTPESIIRGLNSEPGQPSPAEAVDGLFAAAVLHSRATRALSATESATAETPTSPRDATEPARPAHEPIIVARKPLSGTVAANVLTHGTGGINVDATRVSSAEKLVRPSVRRDDNEVFGKGLGAGAQDEPAGRWPTNVVLVHHPDCADQCEPGCAVAGLDAQSGTTTSSGGKGARSGKFGAGVGGYGHDGSAVGQNAGGLGDSGGASRFFPQFRYQAKAPTKERPSVNGVKHPTVKPLELMRWLVRLVTPPGGTVVDPFAGSGTTGQAAELEGFGALLIEEHEPYLGLVEARMAPLTPEEASA